MPSFTEPMNGWESTSTPGISHLEHRLAISRAVYAAAGITATSYSANSATPPCVAPVRAKLASAGIEYLSTIVNQLNELWRGPESDDYGRLRPTPTAFATAVDLLIDAAIDAAREGRKIPAGVASTDSEGGVRIEWVRDATSVHLAVPAEDSQEKAYIYHEDAGEYGTEPATSEALSHRLRGVSP